MIKSLKFIDTTYGISAELASDGWSEFTVSVTKAFLKDCGVYHRLLSVAYPDSNCRAEIGVKTAKRIIADNTGVKGVLNTDVFKQAILQYRNSHHKETMLSFADFLFGHPLGDLFLW